MGRFSGRVEGVISRFWRPIWVWPLGQLFGFRVGESGDGGLGLMLYLCEELLSSG